MKVILKVGELGGLLNDGANKLMRGRKEMDKRLIGWRSEGDGGGFLWEWRWRVNESITAACNAEVSDPPQTLFGQTFE